LNPTDPESEDRNWVGQVWLNIIRGALGLQVRDLSFECLPAVGRVTVSSPAVARALVTFNESKPYSEQIKPFNFLLTCHIKQLGHPMRADPKHFHLIAPYESDPKRWLKLDWFDQYTGNRYQITTADDYGTQDAARVKTYGDVLIEYEFHPESKCADANGNPCGKQTVGLLQRRNIRVNQIKYIGKESNLLEDVESGLIHSEQSVYAEYPDPRRDEWQTNILPALKKAPLALLVKNCRGNISRRALIEMRAGRSRPHSKNQKLIEAALRKPET
jgi:hypothetical protein